MPDQNRIVRPGKTERSVLTDAGKQLEVPDGWSLLPPGDAPLTKSVKAKGSTWLVQVKYKRRFISKGIWAKDEHILAAQNELEAKRSAPGYAKKRQQDLTRKEKKHQKYVQDFYTEVLDFLDFHSRYTTFATQLARSITEFATPVGSGTVARTERIPLEDRARSAVIAWMRHQTTGYDQMYIARIKGRRREVRRMLAERAKELLRKYRSGQPKETDCPLCKALSRGN